MSSMQLDNMLRATADEKKIHTCTVNTHKYQTNGAPTGQFIQSFTCLPTTSSFPGLLCFDFHRCFLCWPNVGSSGAVSEYRGGLDDEERRSMFEDQCLTWRRARENAASVLFSILTTPYCNSFPDSQQLKERSAYLRTVLFPPLTSHPHTPLSFFFVISHLPTSFAFTILSRNPREKVLDTTPSTESIHLRPPTLLLVKYPWVCAWMRLFVWVCGLQPELLS